MAAVVNTPPRRSNLSLTLEFLGSMPLAITLLMAVSIASVIGTVLQQNQPYNDYIQKFGPFWHSAFERLGLYDVYSAGWFLAVLTFLVVSTTVCVYRNAPSMLRDMRNYQLGYQARSLKRFKHSAEAVIEPDLEEASAYARRALAAHGFRVREKDQRGGRLIAGMRGGANRLGYIFAHTSIVVICVGALMDGRLPIKVAEMMGEVTPETRIIPASEVPEGSIVGSFNPSFRGTVDIPEGQSANVVFLALRDGYLVQRLPFDIELKEFRVEHYSTGAPRSFESDLVVRDPDYPEPIEATISVNDPLIHRGYAIYQSSFGDGGSNLAMRLWPVNPGRDDPRPLQADVFENYTLDTSQGPLTLELTDFRLYNINPVLGSDGETRQQNMGPSFVYRLRDETGFAREYETYMLPLKQGDRYYFLSGVRSQPSEDFRFLHIPVDPSGRIDRFMRLLAYIHSPDLVRQVAEVTTDQAMNRTGIDGDGLATQISGSMAQLVLLFAEGGFDALARHVEASVPEAERPQATQAFIRVLQTGMGGVYRQLLLDEGITEPTERDWLFLEDAITAVGALPNYGSPYFMQLADFNQIEASGLQITKSPGKNIVYFGSIVLTIGIFLLFYMAHQRVWVWLGPREEGGGTEMVLAGVSNRNMLEFEKRFAAVKGTMFAGLKPVDAHTQPDNGPTEPDGANRS